MKAEKALAKVEEFLKPLERTSEPESITDEERFMFRKLGMRMKAFLLLGICPKQIYLFSQLISTFVDACFEAMYITGNCLLNSDVKRVDHFIEKDVYIYLLIFFR